MPQRFGNADMSDSSALSAWPQRWRAASPEVPTIAAIEDHEFPSGGSGPEHVCGGWVMQAWAVVNSSARTELTLPAHARSISEARSFVTRAVHDVVDDADPVLLMASELVTNVVLHANTDVTVSVTRGPPVRVEVRDGAAATDAFRELSPPSTAAMRPGYSLFAMGK
jgi:hypothetical protein